MRVYLLIGTDFLVMNTQQIKNSIFFFAKNEEDVRLIQVYVGNILISSCLHSHEHHSLLF